MQEKILLVDDNVAFIDSIKDVLEEEGYGVETAYTGETPWRWWPGTTSPWS
jgi:CheY-like chemotaxis protein